MEKHISFLGFVLLQIQKLGFIWYSARTEWARQAILQKMNKDKEEQSVDGADFHFHIVQPLRDLESNWAVDLAKNLEEYLLKICSGEISGEDDTHLSVNFAEGQALIP